MARGYPRFLFSDPKNTKSEGPFIVHCLEPRLIFKISVAHANIITCVDDISEIPNSVMDQLFKDINAWLHFQITSGELKLQK